MTSLSILIVVHNEEKQLKSCLKSISFGNELVVILDKCTDKSEQIAKILESINVIAIGF